MVYKRVVVEYFRTSEHILLSVVVVEGWPCPDIHITFTWQSSPLPLPGDGPLYRGLQKMNELMVSAQNRGRFEEVAEVDAFRNGC